MTETVNLSGRSRRKLREALQSGFKEYDVLNRFAVESLGTNLNTRTHPSAGLDTAIDTLMTLMDENSRVAELVHAARAERPGNVFLRDVEQELGLTFDPFGDPQLQSALASPAARGQVERTIVQSAGFPTSEQVISALGVGEYRVCYLAYGLPGGSKVFGTAFLIGNDLLMTNFHVIEKASTPFPLAGEQIHAVFDYRSANSVPTVHTLASRDWLVAHDPEKRSDGTSGLDYAILRLSTEVANQAIGSGIGAATRGYFRPLSYEPSTNEPILILQHPYDKLDAAPSSMRLTIGSVLGVEADEIRDSANTSEGSSGSPVFNSRMELVAIHYWGDVKFNAAKKMSAIKADLAAKGFRDLLK